MATTQSRKVMRRHGYLNWIGILPSRSSKYWVNQPILIYKPICYLVLCTFYGGDRGYLQQYVEPLVFGVDPHGSRQDAVAFRTFHTLYATLT